MSAKNKIFSILAMSALVVGGLVTGLTRVSAEDASEALQKQNEAMLEAQKKEAENLLEAQKKSLENSLEAQKKEQENLRESQKKQAELQKEASSSKDSEEIDTEDDESSVEENDQEDGERHRSVVANFVQSLEKIASSSPRGIGERVREVARSQNEDKDKTVKDINEIISRGAFVKFLIGANQDAIKSLESSISEIQSHIGALNDIKASSTPDVQKSLDKQINVLAKEKIRVETVVNSNKNVNGIFGWLINFFR